jgi:O-succinylbenzoic acid--CoA ligase
LTGSGDAVFAGPLDATLPPTVPQRVSLVVQSSGSTGRPKRVELSADALLASAAAAETFLESPGQWLLALPTTYIAGLNVVVRSITADTDLVTIGDGPFTAASFIEAANRMTEPVRFTSLVPTQLARILEVDVAAAALARFERVLLGGQAAPAGLLARAADRGIRVTRTYGASETSGGCIYDGSPVGATTVRITDGQVEIAGPTLAEGYLLDPERSDAAFYFDDGNRWYRTGDSGFLDGGILTVTGRLDDVIISGGVKVSLAEVEAAVASIPGLAGAVVVRAASEEWGEVPVVVSTVDVDLDTVRAHVAGQLGAAAAPAAIEVVELIPLLASGKPDRALLASRLAR